MRFLVDEDLPRSVSLLLRQYGHDAVDVRDIGLRGASDVDIAAYAEKNRLCLLTGDMGFADIRNYQPEKYRGIVVVRPPANATSSVISLLLRGFLIQSGIVNNLDGKLVVVEPGRVRIRRGQ